MTQLLAYPFFDVKVEGKREGGKKPPRKEMGYSLFPDVNRIGRP